MPRGVAIPELDEQLFQATERLLARDGPSGLATRAITSEAGFAKGVLHNHFGDLDGFLAEFVQSRFWLALQAVAELPAKAGQGTVEDNLTDMADALLNSPVLAAHSVLLFRPSLIARLHERRQTHAAGGSDAPSPANLALILDRYLDAEKRRGRVRADADTSIVALAIVATVLHLLMSGHLNANHLRETVHRVIRLLAGAITPSS
jgi:AcrR family transcriptional regulator